LPLVHEFERVVVTVAEFGLAAVRDPSKAQGARERAVLNASMQLIRVDRGRIDLSAATISSEHPQHAVLVATQHYYNALIAIPTYALDHMDGRGDPAGTAAMLRVEAQTIRREMRRGEMLTRAMIETLPTQLAGGPPDLLEAALQAFRTYPATIRAFGGLADGVDAAAVAIERGDHPLDVWADQEESDRPYLDEMDRLDAARLQLIANNNRRAL
jgi:hypothetical protein